MCIMEFFKIYLLIFLLCNSVHGISEPQQKKGKLSIVQEIPGLIINFTRLQVLELIFRNEIWKNDVSFTKIIYKGRVTSLKDYRIYTLRSQFELEAKKLFFNKVDKIEFENFMKIYSTQIRENGENLKTLHINAISVLFEASKLMYLSLKCKYSDLIVESLRVFSEILLACQTIQQLNERHTCETVTITHFTAKKNYFEKMLYNILITINTFPNLKFDDQMLLKALISVHLFLQYYSKTNDIPKSEFFYVKTITQMISSVERFRCQKCYVLNYFNPEHYKIREQITTKDYNYHINEIFSPTFKTLSFYSNKIDILSMESILYEEGMYEINYLTIGYIFDFEEYSSLCTMVIKKRNMKQEMKLYEIFQNVIKSYDIKTLFEYQILIIDVITDLFTMQFLHFNNPINCSKEITCSMEFLRLLPIFNNFIHTVLPDNFSRNSINEMKEISNNITRDIETYYNSEYSITKNILTEDTVNKLKVKVIVNNKQSQVFVKQLSIAKLIQNIINHKHFKSFTQFFKLFLSEPNTLDFYQLYMLEYDKQKKNINYTDSCCFLMSKLRKSLFLLQILTSKKYTENFDLKNVINPDFAILTAIDSLNTSLAFLHKTYSTTRGNIKIDEIIKMIVPISMRLKTYRHDTIIGPESLMLGQHLIMTANLIENFETKIGCPKIFYNDKMYAELLHNLQLFRRDSRDVIIDFDENYIKNQIIDHIPKESLESLSTDWVDKFYPDDFFMYYNSKFNLVTINWEGTEEKVNDVLMSITQDVIDYSYIERFYLMKLKWFIYNIFTKMVYVAENKNYLYPATTKSQITLSTIRDDFLKISKLTFPILIRAYLSPIFITFMSIFVDLDSPESIKFVQEKTIESRNIINEELNYLDIIYEAEKKYLNDQHVKGGKGNKNDTDDRGDKDDKDCKDNVDGKENVSNQGNKGYLLDKLNPQTTTISLDLIHNELQEDHEFLNKILNPSSRNKVSITKHNFIYVY